MLDRAVAVETAYDSTCETDSPQTVQQAWMMPRGYIRMPTDVW